MPGAVELETVVCVYTCERHAYFRRPFYDSVVGQHLLGLPNSRLLEVYADPDIQASTEHAGRLTVRAEERYEALSLKTLAMLRYCTSHFNFRKLIKIDVAAVRTDFTQPEYASRQPFDLDRMVEFLENAPGDRDYAGFLLHVGVSRDNVLAWAAQKGRQVDFERLFGTGVVPPYFTGVCYMMSAAFARYVADVGADMAQEHVDYLNGAEDVMIGRLFPAFAGFRERESSK